MRVAHIHWGSLASLFLLIACSSEKGAGSNVESDDTEADDSSAEAPDGGAGSTDETSSSSSVDPVTGATDTPSTEPSSDPATEPGGTDTSDGETATDPDSTSDPPPDVVADCGARTLPPQALRRLSSEEYHNTLLDLLGEDLGRRAVDGSRFPPTVIRSGFSADAEANVVNTAESNAIEDNAERIATLVDQDPDAFLRQLLPCTLPQTVTDADVDGCVDEFITTFGTRAYRRPITSAETTLARGVYDATRASNSAASAFAGLLQYFVQAPALLYRVERGEASADTELLALTGYERATRLSYFLTGSMPDAELFAAAEAGQLATSEQVRVQAERLLAGERFYDVLGRFHRDWLELHGFDYKEASLFPSFDEARGALEQEASRYARYVFTEGDGSIQAMLGGETVPVNDALARYYGVTVDDANADTWVPTALPNRKGLFTLGSVMATLADSAATHPIHRGAFFQTQVLCRSLPALPGNVDIQGPLQDTSSLPTARERLSPLLERADCSVCHNLINPVGLAFEHYDAAGGYRDVENGAPIVGSGSLVLDGQTLDFENPVALMDLVAVSTEARECYALNWFRASVGRPEFEEDACSLAPLQQAALDSGGDLRATLLTLVQTDAFLFRRNEP